MSVSFALGIIRSGRPSSRIVMAVAALIGLAGIVLMGKAAVIQAKALLAQMLLERAFAQSVATGEPVKAWSWADSWPVARLEMPRLEASAIVLKGASGEALAFGPGHLDGTPLPGEAGASVIAAHRDTHFRFLREARLGDEIRVTRADGAIFRFRIKAAEVVRWDASEIDPHEDGNWLVLSACWPFDASTSGDLRYILRAQLIARQIPATNPPKIAQDES
jgi:sortase A